MSQSSVVVTGASGFIGRATIDPLRARGFQIHAFSSRPGVEIAGAIVHGVDLLHADAVDQALAAIRPTHLLHLAWVTEPPGYWTSPDNLRWVEASLHLVDTFQRLGGRRAVVAGTCAEYDWSTGTCAETSPLRPGTFYGIAKTSLWQLLDAYAKLVNLELAWGRVFFTFGPREHSSRLVPSVIRGLLAHERVPCTEGSQARDFMHVGDLADAFSALLASTVTGAVNIASGTALTIRQLVAKIAQQLGGEQLVDFGGLPSRANDPARLVADVTRLAREVGWQPSASLDARIAETIAWWRAQGQVR